MILVNLLPEDRRPVERTPLPRFLTILGGVIGFCIEGIFIVYLITLIPNKNVELERWRLRENQAEQILKKIAEFHGKIKTVEKQVSNIEKLTNERRLWGPILYRLCDPALVTPMFWYTGIEVKARKARGGETEETLIIEGYASSTNEDDAAQQMAQVMNFVGNLQKPYAQFSDQLEGVPRLERLDGGRTLPHDKKLTPEGAPKLATSFEIQVPLKVLTKAKQPQRRQRGAP